MQMGSHKMDRRRFLWTGATSALALGMPTLTFAEETKDPSKLIVGKHPKMEVLSTDPLVFQTPLDLLAKHNLTPKELIFVRNNQHLKGSSTIKPFVHKGWSFRLTGLVSKKTDVNIGELAKLPQVKYRMVLQCSGNGRSLFAQAVKTSGTQWGLGAIANVEFAGVRLSEVMKKFNVSLKDQVRFVTARGMDSPTPGKEDFEHSIPIDDVLERTILATHLNGETLPAIHGGPLRLITPGYYATVNVKWLTELEFVDSESTNYNHVPRYRTPYTPIKPGTDFKATLTNSKPTWKMKLATLILTPSQNAEVKAGRVEVTGIAYNDGEAKITSVTVSFDQGKTWHRANLQSDDVQYSWTRWKIVRNLKPGTHQIWARAFDAFGRSQPLDGTLFWNPRGYEWNGVSKLNVKVSG